MTASTDRRGTQQKRKRYRVLIVDDHPVVRCGVSYFLHAEPDLEVCGEATDAASALVAIERHQPDIVLVDVSLRDVSGYDLTKSILLQRPQTKVLVFSVHDERLYAERAFTAGATGYIMKNEPPEELIKAIHQVLKGERYLSGGLKEHLADKYITGGRLRAASDGLPLGPREFEVYQLLSQGRSTREIAAAMRISIKTIESHYTHIKDKLNLINKTQLVQHAVHWSRSTPEASAPPPST